MQFNPLPSKSFCCCALSPMGWTRKQKTDEDEKRKYGNFFWHNAISWRGNDEVNYFIRGELLFCNIQDSLVFQWKTSYK